MKTFRVKVNDSESRGENFRGGDAIICNLKSLQQKSNGAANTKTNLFRNRANAIPQVRFLYIARSELPLLFRA